MAKTGPAAAVANSGTTAGRSSKKRTLLLVLLWLCAFLAPVLSMTGWSDRADTVPAEGVVTKVEPVTVNLDPDSAVIAFTVPGRGTVTTLLPCWSPARHYRGKGTVRTCPDVGTKLRLWYAPGDPTAVAYGAPDSLTSVIVVTALWVLGWLGLIIVWIQRRARKRRARLTATPAP